MNGKKDIILLSDFDVAGSGYTNIARVFGNKLSDIYNVIGLGISYERRQHTFKFGVSQIRIPYILSALKTINAGAGVRDVIIFLDIPLTESILNSLKPEDKALFNFIGVYAVEADPICATWAMDLLKINHRFPISQFGEDECKKIGIFAQHLVVPLELDVWKLKTPEEQSRIKKSMGLDNKTVFFMNADGNERKNLSVVYEALSILKKKNIDAFLVLLTRINSPISWKLNDLALELDINDRILLLDRGLQMQDVRQLYAMSDFFLNPSKAEGLGMGILEAMAVGTPVIATNCTAMKEHLLNGKRGITLEPDYIWRDPFGNGRRYFIYPEHLADEMENAVNHKNDFIEQINEGRKYIESRTIDSGMKLLESALSNE